MAFWNYIVSSFTNGFRILAFGLLPYIALAFFMQFLSKSLRKNFTKGILGKLFVYLTFPGVVIHELGHVFFCFIFGHEVLEMKLFAPDKNGTLGYVNHRYNPKNYYQRFGNFFIGTGPVWFGVVALFLFSWLLLPKGMIGTGDNLLNLLKTFFSGFIEKGFWVSWKTWVWFYLSFSIAAHVTLSKADLHGTLDGLILIVGVIFFSSLILGWCGSWEEQLLHFERYVLVTLLAMMISFLVILTVPLFVIQRITKMFVSKKAPVEEKI